jgi:hypothetical protein
LLPLKFAFGAQPGMAGFLYFPGFAHLSRLAANPTLKVLL